MTTKKKKPVPDAKLTGIYLAVEDFGYAFKQLRLVEVKPPEPWEFVVPEKKPAFFVVVVTYTSGDSFGRYPEQTAYAYVTEDYGEACEVGKRITQHADDVKSGRIRPSHGKKKWKSWDEQFKAETSIDFTHKGKPIHVEASRWNGYFESLDGVDVVLAPVLEKQSNENHS